MTATRKRFDAMQHPVSVRSDWETPPEFFAKLDAEFGFTMDVCATPENAKHRNYFTPSDDGLSQPWCGATCWESPERVVCWMNPPYGVEIPKWIAKAAAESRLGATVVCLVPARVDTRWWHEHVEGRAEVRFVKGRIKFVGAKFNAPFPCAIVVFRAVARPPQETNQP